MKDKRTVIKVWFNGREFHRVIWHDVRVWISMAVTEHVQGDHIMRGTLMTRREQ